MDLLLDTMAFIWWASEPERLPEPVRAACAHAGNRLVVSVASIWEIQTKMEVDRVKMRPTLPLSDDATLDQIIVDQQADGVQFSPIELRHVRGMVALPWRHKDPFDRIILATALVDEFILISSDGLLEMYVQDGIRLLW
jgi:PIN domain nuclease of toxin-antitoxin system